MVVDSTDRERLTISKEELHKMLESDELCKAAVLVFANKQVRKFAPSFEALFFTKYNVQPLVNSF